jgi:hypothetical protein
MNIMTRILLLLFLSLSIIRCNAQQTEDWTSLFNGKNLDGWSVIGGAGKVAIEDNTIVLNRSSNTEEHTFICTDKVYKDFIMEVDAMGGDGSLFYGILFRAQPAPDTAHVRLYGYQVKPDSRKRNWIGGIFDDFGTAWNWMYTPEGDSRAQNARKPVGQWDHYRIEAIGDTIKVWLNDVPISNISNSKYDKGKIAIKIHFMKGDQPEKEKNTAWVKNIKIVAENVRQFSRSMDIPLVLVE